MGVGVGDVGARWRQLAWADECVRCAGQPNWDNPRHAAYTGSGTVFPGRVDERLAGNISDADYDVLNDGIRADDGADRSEQRAKWSGASRSGGRGNADARTCDFFSCRPAYRVCRGVAVGTDGDNAVQLHADDPASGDEHPGGRAERDQPGTAAQHGVLRLPVRGVEHDRR